MAEAEPEKLGLFQLYDPAETGIVPLVDIILVHGLNGHYLNTWKADDGTVWPVNLLPEKMPDARVLSFGYRGTYRDTGSIALSYDHGLNLLHVLVDSRRKAHEANCPIIFVGHSLGGIIIKQTLLISKDRADSDPRASNIIQSTYGIVFFATPHNGIKSEPWEQFVRLLVGHSRPDELQDEPIPSDIAREIRRDSPGLARLSQRFRDVKGIQYVTFLEGLNTPHLRKVLVTKGDAIINDEETRMPSRHHFAICQFSREGQGLRDFKQVLGVIEKIRVESPKTKYFGDIGREVLDSLFADKLRANPLAVKHTKGTCDWITRKDAFKSFQDLHSGKNNLWILGKPGCGKTYLAKHIAKLLAYPGRNVVQCYLDEVPEEQSSGHTVLLILLYKVLDSHPHLISQFMVKMYYERKSQKDIWDSETLKTLWIDVLSEATMRYPLTLIVDGLDQCRGDTAAEFFACYAECKDRVADPGRLKLLVVSRDGHAHEDHSEDTIGFTTYTITEQDTREDIDRSVRECLETTLMKRQYEPDFRKLIRQKISGGADGMYLWARIMAEEVKLVPLSDAQLRLKLHRLPKGIVELYDSILGRIGENAEQKSLIKFVLFWAAFRHETLKTEDLRVGIAMSTLKQRGIPVSEGDLEAFLPKYRIQTTVARCCGHLIKFSGDRVNLVHRSLRQFLTTPREDVRRDYPAVKHHRDYYFEKSGAHRDISDFCVAYLLLPAFENAGEPFDRNPPGPLDWERKLCDRISRYDFVAYAARSWVAHVRFSGEPFSVKKNRNRHQNVLLDLRKQQAICWTEVWWYFHKWQPLRQNYPGRRFPLDDIFSRERIAPLPLPQDSFAGGTPIEEIAGKQGYREWLISDASAAEPRGSFGRDREERSSVNHVPNSPEVHEREEQRSYYDPVRPGGRGYSVTQNGEDHNKDQEKEKEEREGKEKGRQKQKKKQKQKKDPPPELNGSSNATPIPQSASSLLDPKQRRGQHPPTTNNGTAGTKDGRTSKPSHAGGGDLPQGSGPDYGASGGMHGKGSNNKGKGGGKSGRCSCCCIL